MSAPVPEVWGGIECTVARIGDRWRNQVDELGIALGRGELDALANLGIRTLRFPVLWETVCPDTPDECDWRWHDERLQWLRETGVRVIAGLVHHGSGPRYTNLLDPRFAERLAAYAARVAARYPWIDAWTPVNEPLTTARFAALYGHWYPHARDPSAFLRAVVNQCRATVLAMRAVRRVNPHATLVQTEDLGKTYATPRLRYQAEHENERRWLSWDLLSGRVDRTHPLHRYLVDSGIGEAELRFFDGGEGSPDIVGVNHYLTGERYLDEHCERYPARFHGDNGRERYADVEAVRIAECGDDVGPEARLREAWERYRRPIAVTEVHHGCTRDEQVRWLMEVWDAACKLRSDGADVRAVTLWSLFGAVDWNSLLVEAHGHYEPGAFDARSRPPRPTLLARAAASLAHGERFRHAVTESPGWWRRPDRYLVGGETVPRPVAARTSRARPRELLITGATGTLGRAFARLCGHRGLPHVSLTRGEMDIADGAGVARVIDERRPWAIVNTAGYVRVADADRQQERCFRDNREGAEALAAACARHAIPLVTFSSDLVFDGALGRAYVESDEPRPACTYGRSKAEAESRVLATWPGALVVRTSAFFGPWDRYNFVCGVIGRLQAGLPIAAATNVEVSPTYVPDLVHATLDLLLDEETGLWHLASRGASSWYALAVRTAEELGLPRDLVEPVADARSRNTALDTLRGTIMPTFDSAFARFLGERDVGLSMPPGERA